MKKIKTLNRLIIFCIVITYSFSLNAQNKEVQCEQFYKDAKSAYDKGDYEVALIFFNRCKTEGCTNADFQIYIDVCNLKLGKKNNATIINGVTINGVTWAIKNVGAFDASDYGKYYTWHEAKNICPDGWRLPTKKEFESLINSGSTWTTINGKNGRKFGDSKNFVFLPAAVEAVYLDFEDPPLGDKIIWGYYWSFTSFIYDDVSILRFSRHSAYISTSQSSADGHSVRCVKE